MAKEREEQNNLLQVELGKPFSISPTFEPIYDVDRHSPSTKTEFLVNGLMHGFISLDPVNPYSYIPEDGKGDIFAPERIEISGRLEGNKISPMSFPTQIFIMLDIPKGIDPHEFSISMFLEDQEFKTLEYEVGRNNELICFHIVDKEENYIVLKRDPEVFRRTTFVIAKNGN